MFLLRAHAVRMARRTAYRVSWTVPPPPIMQRSLRGPDSCRRRSCVAGNSSRGASLAAVFHQRYSSTFLCGRRCGRSLRRFLQPLIEAQSAGRVSAS
ncbi:hypothetical protein VFPBJ_10822 [Purpureocillium lilacinum]|uniref:Uncharacterized protein n=1 Tax=Purpureocillium lilacinum TaxID=33203 RepID=A0A179FVP9_PURLI|nr:hypothetical protein VFPBJ_10822 [Purpureocillium lilacinum]